MRRPDEVDEVGDEVGKREFPLAEFLTVGVAILPIEFQPLLLCILTVSINDILCQVMCLH